MSGGKHTPGPWKVSTRQGTSNGIEHSGGFVAFASPPRSADESLADGESWLAMRERTQPERLSIEREKQANARLIAAAPELLEALQLMLEQFTKTPSTLKDSEARIKAHAALSRATGRKS